MSKYALIFVICIIMIELNQLQFQKLDLSGVQTLVQWAEKEGWNPGLNDAEVYWGTDPGGYYGYFQEGELIAGGSIVSYRGEFGFMGFFIVKPELRSYGIGRKLWYERRDKLISRLNEGATIGMDGVVAMQKFYQKGGFEIAFKDVRYEMIGHHFEIDKRISPIIVEDLDAVLRLDKECFGFARPQFMLPWLNMPHIKTFKFVDEGILQGFAVVRKCNIGYKICPLFADNSLVAEELYKACIGSVADDKIYIDIPEINQAANRLVEKYKGQYVFECARMYRGTAPAIDIDKVFGITTFELG